MTRAGVVKRTRETKVVRRVECPLPRRTRNYASALMPLVTRVPRQREDRVDLFSFCLSRCDTANMQILPPFPPPEIRLAPRQALSYMYARAKLNGAGPASFFFARYNFTLAGIICTAGFLLSVVPRVRESTRAPLLP